MAKTQGSSARQKGKPNPRKATMTSRSQFLLGRKLLLKASGTQTLQDRANISHARLWQKKEIKKFFSVEYMEEQLERAHRQTQWLRLTQKRKTGGIF